MLSICKNRLCAVSVKNDRVSKTGGGCSLDHSAVFLLHSCPWSLEPSRAVVNIHMLSIHRSRLQAASLDKKEAQTRSEFPPRQFTQTMVRVNSQNGDGGGSWVGDLSRYTCCATRVAEDFLRKFCPKFAFCKSSASERGHARRYSLLKTI